MLLAAVLVRRETTTMPGHCSECGRKGTKSGTRKIDETTKVCNECAPAQDRSVTIDPESMLGELSFREFTVWFKSEVDDVIRKKVEEATKGIVKEVEAAKKSAKAANDEIAELKTQVSTLSNSLKEITKENEQLKKTCANNLKYLVNHDRNSRRPNVMVLGLSEEDELTIGETSAADDDGKISSLLNFIGVKEDEYSIVNHSRLGNSEGEGTRPIKMTLKNSEMASLIISNAYKLKDLNKKIFLKPDKSFKEREEFQRLLKRKQNAYFLIQRKMDRKAELF